MPRRKFEIILDYQKAHNNYLEIGKAVEYNPYDEPRGKREQCEDCTMTVTEDKDRTASKFKGDFPYDCPMGRNLETLLMEIGLS